MKATHMSTRMFIDLPIKDLGKSVAFFKSLGFAHNPKFTDETAACIVFSDDINAMLLTHSKFKKFARKPMSEAHKTQDNRSPDLPDRR